MDKIPLKKRPEEFVIEANVKRKEGIIDSLEERLQTLKQELTKQTKKRKGNDNRVTVEAEKIDKYLLGITEGKEDQEL